jgi:hypothetical protein
MWGLYMILCHGTLAHSSYQLKFSPSPVCEICTYSITCARFEEDRWWLCYIDLCECVKLCACKEHEVHSLLGCVATQSGRLLPAFQRNMLLPSSLFTTLECRWQSTRIYSITSSSWSLVWEPQILYFLIFVLALTRGLHCVWLVYSILCWYKCPEIGTSSVDMAQLNRFYLKTDRIQSPKRCVFK